jgi:hypothetical protein
MPPSDFVEETYYGIIEKIKLIEFKSLLRLLMVLPNARRQEFAAVLHHFFAGDERLVAQIQTNATSQNILQTIARKSLEAERGIVQNMYGMSYQSSFSTHIFVKWFSSMTYEYYDLSNPSRKSRH